MSVFGFFFNIKLTTSGPGPLGVQRTRGISSGMLDSLYIFGSTAGWFIYSYLIETKNKKPRTNKQK